MMTGEETWSYVQPVLIDAIRDKRLPGAAYMTVSRALMAMDDQISRQAAIDALDRIFDRCEEIEAHLPEGDPDRTGYKMYPDYMTVWKYLRQLPSAQPDIIQCLNCKFASGDSRICMKFGHSPIGELDFCAWAERRTDG